MASTAGYLSSASPTLVRSQQSSTSCDHSLEKQKTYDASHCHSSIPRHQSNDDKRMSTLVSPSSMPTSDNTEETQNINERKFSIPLKTITKDETVSVAENMITSSSLSSNQIITTIDVQNNNNEVSPLNHNISSNATITEFHSTSSDLRSLTPRFISSFNQQSHPNDNDESLSPLLPLTTTSSSWLTHQQSNHSDDMNLENGTQTNKNMLTNNNKTSIATVHNTIERNKG